MKHTGESWHCPRRAAVSKTSRSSFARLDCWNPPDVAAYSNMLRLVRCTQPRSNTAAFGGGINMRPPTWPFVEAKHGSHQMFHFEFSGLTVSVGRTTCMITTALLQPHEYRTVEKAVQDSCASCGS